MGDFFKPWRRKFGVLTLLVACVFMAGWFRSFLVKDVFIDTTTTAHQSPLKDNPIFTQRFAITANGNVEFIFWNSTLKITKLKSGFHQALLPSDTSFCEPKVTESQHISCGIQIKRGKIFPWCQATVYLVPLLTLVIPLTLLSAYLLLSRPCQSNSEKITDPIAVEGS